MSEDQPYSYPIRCSITITKPTSKGALVVDALAQDGSFLCDSIAYYGDASVAAAQGAEGDWQRRGLYFGPQFEQLDVAVQEEFERFLSERGIDESLALFIPDFAEYKEQKVRQLHIARDEGHLLTGTSILIGVRWLAQGCQDLC